MFSRKFGILTGLVGKFSPACEPWTSYKRLQCAAIILEAHVPMQIYDKATYEDLYITFSRGSIGSQTFSHLPYLKHLTIDNSVITHITILPKDIESLTLYYNKKFPKLRKRHFASCPNLKRLELRGNRELDIEAEAFYSSTALVEVVIRNQENLSLNVGNIFGKSVRKLDLQVNKLVTLPDDIFSNFVNITIIDLSHNMIQKFRPGTFDNNSNLMALYMEKNNADFDFFSFEEIPSLKTLSFYGSKNIKNFSVLRMEEVFPGILEVNISGIKDWSCQYKYKISQELSVANITVSKCYDLGCDFVQGKNKKSR